jgi:hypothetical protein
MPRPITPTTVAAPSTNRPNRILVALAAAWMILSLAIGGAVNAESGSSAAPAAGTVTTATQP